MENNFSFEQILEKSNNIFGWLSRRAAFCIYSINEIQKQEKISGSIFEIGCHFGKTAVFLNHLIKEDEFLYVCDIFENQEDNTSTSGYNPNLNIQSFLKNILKYSNIKNLKILKCNSLSLTPERLKNKFRIIHIDGGHSKNEVISDLKLSSQCLIDGGVIVVDDIFHKDWPEVTSGLSYFLKTEQTIEPIFIAFNKIFLCEKKHAIFYKEKIELNYKKPTINKDISYVNFCDYSVGRV